MSRAQKPRDVSVAAAVQEVSVRRYGLYQEDALTSEGHLYGELSWGFVEVEAFTERLAVTFYRWLSYPDFLEITAQSHGEWRMKPLDDATKRARRLYRAVPVRSFEKRWRISSDLHDHE